MKYNTTVFLLLIISVFTSFGQIEYAGRPTGSNTDLTDTIPYILVKYLDDSTNIINKNIEKEFRYKVSTFGESVSLHVSNRNEGIWQQAGERYYIWRIGITSKNAGSLGITFSPFKLNLGSKLFLYTPDQKIVRGAYTFRNNKESEVFAIAPLAGDSLIIELQVFGSPHETGELVISRVGIGYPTIEQEINEKDGWFGWSAECEIDINCLFNENIQRQKYATCRVIYGNTNRCTGTLINNTRQDGTPYVLTGGHCIKNESDAESAIFAFNYESPYCDGPDGKIKSISGSTIVSRSPDLDFVLVQLSEKPPANFFPLYSGWDASGEIVDYTYVPHHPEGDVKKITIDNDSLLTGTFGQYDPNTHWLITRYELGTTEDGSSGGPLYDTLNRLIGTLTGGGAACSVDIYDYYQKFSHCWDDYPDNDEQLKYWLDPLNTGTLTLTNYMPMDPVLNYSEELSNIAPHEGTENLFCEDLQGWLTGQNLSNASDYLEHYFVNGSKYIYAVWLDIANLFFSDSRSKISLKIWEGNAEPGNIVYSKDIYLFELQPDTLNYIMLDTMLIVNGNFFVGYEVFYDLPADTFSVKMVYNATPRDINTAYRLVPSKGYSPFTDLVWEPLSCGEQLINTSLAIYPVVFNYYIPKNQDLENFPLNEVTLYPNPAYDHVQVLFKSQPEGTVTVKVYDLNGRLMDTRAADSPEPNIRLDTSRLIRGMYIIKIDYSGGTVFKKLLIL